MENFAPYLEMLELKPGATREQIKEAYRDLVNIWHPDRFEHNPRLKEKAAEKLKLINEANDKLKFYAPSQTDHAKNQSMVDVDVDISPSSFSENSQFLKVSSSSFLFLPPLGYISGVLAALYINYMGIMFFYHEISEQVGAETKEATTQYTLLDISIGVLAGIFALIFIYYYYKAVVASNKFDSNVDETNKIKFKLIESLVFFIAHDGVITEEEEFIIYDLVSTLGIDKNIAKELINKIKQNIINGDKNFKEIIKKNAKELSDYFDQKSKLQILSLFELAMKADGRITSTERELYGQFKKIFNSLSFKDCPVCGSARVNMISEREVDRWTGTKRVSERLASGKYKTRVVRTTFIQIKRSYICDECKHTWDKFEERER